MIKSITGISISVVRKLNNTLYSDIIAYGTELIPEQHGDLLRAMLVTGYNHGISFLNQKIFLGKTYNDLIPELENMDKNEYIYIETETETCF